MKTTQINAEIKSTREKMVALKACMKDASISISDRKTYYSAYLSAATYLLKLESVKPNHDMVIAQKAMEFIGTAIIITKKAKDLVVGDITALNGIVTSVTIDGNKVMLTIKYPSGNFRAYIWDSSLIIRLK